MHQTLYKSGRYQKFTADRDRALERVHQNMQIDLSRLLADTLYHIENLAGGLALRVNQINAAMSLGQYFEQGTRDILSKAFPGFVSRIISMRRAIFVLTYASEQEAIGRATQRTPKITNAEFRLKLKAATESPTLMGPIDKRVWLALMALRHKIVRAFELAITQDLTAEEIVQKVKDSFPTVETYKRPPKALTRVTEAAATGDKKSLVDLSFIDDADWDLAVSAYEDTELPQGRFDNDYPPPEDNEGNYNFLSKYNWELENEATEDFVSQVKNGKIDAANDLGIQEFAWIAVIDDHTCDDCCLPRNGHTTSEIEAMLASGELDASDCDATSAPAHFNCRCDNGPVASVNEVEGPDWESFNEWLEPKAA